MVANSRMDELDFLEDSSLAGPQILLAMSKLITTLAELLELKAPLALALSIAGRRLQTRLLSSCDRLLGGERSVGHPFRNSSARKGPIATALVTCVATE